MLATAPTATSQRLPSLSRAFYGFILILFVIAAAAVSLFVLARAERFETSVQAESAEMRGEALAMNFSRALGREWSSLVAVARVIDTNSYSAMARPVNAVPRMGGRVAWVGVADLSGRVIAGTDGKLEGRDVSQQPWFRNALEGPYVGDVYESRPLARLIDSEPETVLRYIDMAYPVMGASGQVRAVLVYRMRVSWMRQFLAEASRLLEVDGFFVNTQGETFLSGNAQADGLAPQAARIAATGQGGVSMVEGPDGAVQILHVADLRGAEDMPAMPLRIVTRVTSEPQSGDLRQLATYFALLLAGLGALYLGAAIVFSRYFLRPIDAIAEDAAAVAEGQTRYPRELRRTREMARLSAAVARMQVTPVRVTARQRRRG